MGFCILTPPGTTALILFNMEAIGLAIKEEKMAAAFQCDCCGKKELLVTMTEQSRATGIESGTTFDVCESCYLTICKMFKKEENEK